MKVLRAFRKNSLVSFLIVFVACLLAPVRDARAYNMDSLIHHDIKAKISPREHTITVRDGITVPQSFAREFNFLLHKGLNPSIETESVTVRKEHAAGDSGYESYKVTLPVGMSRFVIVYSGVIFHPLEPVGKEQARGFSNTSGIISEEGVYLQAGSYWYPTFGNTLSTFSLSAELPAGWDAVSQGKRISHKKGSSETTVRWESSEPQDEIFIVAARFTEYTRSSGGINAMVFLREPDKALADKYIDATIRYISMYEKLIGPYPYPKFALVENFWESGFGMPSFTLLGPKIIRFPFIITSSYPHEILHNWWGNSVFPDYSSGNWSEGLTAYLSDHLIKEQQGAGVEYRQNTLQKYVDFVSEGKDFSLTEFSSRHSSSSEAVGYGKSLMFFHMLRREIGDKTFIRGLQDFYEGNKFRVASFNDIRKSFESASGKDLSGVFRQWVERIGAPRIRLVSAQATKDGNEYTLIAHFEQVQQGNAYIMQIPVAITLEGQRTAYQTDVVMEKKQFEMKLNLPSRPLRIDVDPEFDVFRALDREEIPAAISQALGAKKMLVLLPSSAPKNLLLEYRKFADLLGKSGPDEVEVKTDRELNDIPSDRAVTILGWENFFLKDVISNLLEYEVSMDQRNVRVGKTLIHKEDHSLVLTARNPKNRDMAIMFVAGPAEALPGLGRKLPHYNKYSYLGFEGTEPANIAKGRWPVTDSPLTLLVPYVKETSKVDMGVLAPRTPLASLPPTFSREKMMETIHFLSGLDLHGRGLGSKGLDRSAEFIAKKFREVGLKPGGDTDDSYFQTWEETIDIGENKPQTVVLKNVIGLIPGKKIEFSGQSVVVGAHYDHLGLGWPDVRDNNKGRIHPGADDNASGVSILLELAAALAGTGPDRSVVFVAFTGEEDGKRGSRHYVANEKHYPMEKCIGMLNLDTVGRLGKKKLLVLGADSAKEWVHILRGAGFVTGVDVETVSERLDSSDQMSFQDAGVPAIQLFSGPHTDYHRPTDTTDKIDADGLVKVASVAKEIIEYLSSREDRLIKATALGSTTTEESIRKERKVSLGTIPDFGFKGEGYRLSGVEPGSPAEASGLKGDDVIIRINSVTVHGLKDFSDALKSLNPGDRASITIMREGKEMTLETEVKAK